jgi:type I restriction enzyme R subunit
MASDAEVAKAALEQRLAAQTKANMLDDHEALDNSELVFRRESGGFARLDRIFGGELQQVLDTFNESLWAPAA